MFLWLGQWLRLNEGFAHLKVISDSSVNANGKGHFLKQCPCRCSCSVTGVHSSVLINPFRNYAVFCVERMRAPKKAAA